MLVFGDSLVHGGAAPIASGLAREGWQPVVDGRPGWSIEQWVPALPAVVDRARPRIAVVMLGTNDCAPTCQDLASAIDDVMATLARAGVERVVWLNVQRRPTYPSDPGRVDLELQNATARWPRLSIVDLDRALGDDPRLHLADGVHFNDAGNLRLTALILGAVGSAR